MSDAKELLEYVLYGNLDNQLDNDEYLITFVGYEDNYKFVLANYETGEKHHFIVDIKEEEWDSTQALKDQEWDSYE